MRIHERSRPTDDTIFAPTRQGRSAPPTAVAGAAASALQSKNIRSLPINCPFYRKFLTEPLREVTLSYVLSLPVRWNETVYTSLTVPVTVTGYYKLK